MDKYEEEKNEAINKLKQCQIKNNIDDCLKCELVLSCTIRDDFVSIIYKSMNKGETGGFEF
jgi:hypothetical protein